MFKDDALTERKDRERAQIQRDKLRRDLEESRARNASLQEQVIFYIFVIDVFYLHIFFNINQY